MTKTCNASMPRSINGKKNENNKSNIKLLKELNGQVLVSLEQYKAHPNLFLGTIGNNLRLKDRREVVLVKVIGDKAFPLEKVADILLSFILFIAGGVVSATFQSSKRQALMDTARAFKTYCAIMDVLNPGQIQVALEQIRQFDESLYSILNDEEKVESLVAFSRIKNEDARSPKVQLGNECIDVDYLSHLIEWGYKPLIIGLDDVFDSREEFLDFAFTVVVGCIMVTQLRGMGREEAVKFFIDELGHNSKEGAEFLFNLLTINNEHI